MSSSYARLPVDPEPAAIRDVLLSVDGMTCASCATRVRRSLERVAEVDAEVDVDVVGGLARVRTTRSGSDADLVGAVRAAGYGAHVTESAPPSPERGEPLVSRLVVAGLVLVPVLDLSMAAAFTPTHLFTGWRVVLAALVAVAAGWCAWPFHRAAVRLARRREVSMDTLVSLSIVAACALAGVALATSAGTPEPADGLGVLLHPEGPVFLDVVVGVTFFTLLGRVLEGRARRRASTALTSVVDLMPATATRADHAGVRAVVPVAELAVGDHVVVAPGESIPVDGTVVAGRSTVDARAFSGEAVPRVVSEDSDLSCGMVNLTGPVTVRVERAGRQTDLARMVQMVERARAHRAPVQQAVDRVVEVFVPAVLALSALTLLGWLATGATWTDAATAALAVLVVACPCALGLATPAALTVASGRAAQLGVFLRDQGALETLGRVDTLLVDKTGTLTLGLMSLVDRFAPSGGQREHDAVAVALLRESRHPVSRAIAAGLLDRCPEMVPAEDVHEQAGAGLSGTVGGVPVVAGSLAFLREQGVEAGPETASWHEKQIGHGRSVTCLAIAGRAVAAYAVSDALKPTAATTIGSLDALGLRTSIVSGDHPQAVRDVAAAVGVAQTYAHTSPEAKASVVGRLREDGHTVAVLGDGINDAPALARADVGIAVAHGSDAARQAGDVVLLRNDLGLVPVAIALSRATRRTIGQNLTWALLYNALAVPLAVAGLINPLLASAAMAASSLLVVLNSLRLARFGPAPVVAAHEARDR